MTANPETTARRGRGSRSRSRRPTVAGAALLAVALLASSCSSDDAGDAGDVPATAPPATREDPSDTGGGADPDPAPVELELVDLDVDVDQPLDVAVAGGSLLVAERAGAIKELRPDGDGGYTVAGTVIDLTDEVGPTDGEKGLLGIEVAADGSELYVNHTRADDGATVVAAYSLTGGEGSLGAVDGRELVVVPQPFANHNGGHLALDAEGLLYVGMGDGGASNDPDGVAQRLDSLLGKILRLDPSAADAVPADNPYAGGGGEALIWARGVRNPWRISIDPATGDLWVADVGQNRFEEVSVLRDSDGRGRGADLGWDRLEGLEEFDEVGPTDGWPDDDAPVVDPVHVYSHDDGRCSVTGGFVYRGSAIAGLQGRYLFSDFCDGVLRELDAAAAVPGGAGPEPASLGLARPSVVSINPDEDGEVLVLSAAGLSRLRPAP